MPPRFKSFHLYSNVDAMPSSSCLAAGCCVVMTCDITLKKVSQRPVAPRARHGRWLFLSLYILFIYRCHNMSLRQQALLEGLFCVTLKKQPLSSVTAFPILGTADRGSLSFVPSPHLVTL